MARLCFIVPAQGRFPLARIVLGHLASVCEQVDATAVVVADDENFDIAKDLGLRAHMRANTPLGAKLNDGFVRALAIAPLVMPIGTDDLISADLVQRMLEAHESAASPETVICFRRMATVDPAGATLTELSIPYEGGPGIRLYSKTLLGKVGNRPAGEANMRGLDTSIFLRLRRIGHFRYAYVDSAPLELVDLKTEGQNLNTFEMLARYATRSTDDPWTALRTYYPATTVDALESLYANLP